LLLEFVPAIFFLPRKKKDDYAKGYIQLKAGFHMIATIAAIAGKKRSAIVAIMWKPHLSDRRDQSISQQSLKSGFHAIATTFEHFLQRS